MTNILTLPIKMRQEQINTGCCSSGGKSAGRAQCLFALQTTKLLLKNERQLKSFHMLCWISLFPRYQNFKFVTMKKKVKVIRCFRFCTRSHCLRDFNILRFLPSKSKSRSWSIILPMAPFDGKYQNLQMSPTHCCASSYHFRDITILNLLSSKSRSRSWTAIFFNYTIRWQM